MRRILVFPLLALVAAACAPTAMPTPGASGSSGPDYGVFDPNKPTPVPPGLSGTPYPFASSHPATSTITFPENDEQPPIQATYVVGQVQKVDGLVRLSCVAQGKDARGTTMEFRFEAFAATAPDAPASFGVKNTLALAAGEARVSHFRGAGTGWVAPRGAVKLTQLTLDAEKARWDFLVEAPMQPAGTDTKGRGPQPTSAPITQASSAAAPTLPAPSAAPYALNQVNTEFFLRWSGTFYTVPEAGR